MIIRVAKEHHLFLKVIISTAPNSSSNSTSGLSKAFCGLSKGSNFFRFVLPPEHFGDRISIQLNLVNRAAIINWTIQVMKPIAGWISTNFHNQTLAQGESHE